MFDLRPELKLDTTMSFRATALKRSHLIVILLGLGSLSVWGQAANSPIAFADHDAIIVTFVPAPNLGGTNNGGGGNNLPPPFF